MPDPAPAQSTLSPYLTVPDAEAALRFYRRAFAAEETLRLEAPGAGIVHAELAIAGHTVMLAPENPEWDNRSPATLGGTPVRLHLYVADADASAARAVAAGAEIVIPVDDQFYGDRSGRLRDPFGHEWIVASRVEELDAEEMQRRMVEWLADQTS